VRRGLGRGRTLIAIGSILGAIGTFLPWVIAAGEVREAQSFNGFDNAGALLFLVCVLMLALIVAPYATKTRHLAVDRPISYLVLALIGVGALALSVIDLIAVEGNKSLAPLDAPGLWLAIGGMSLVVWGVLELLAERPQAP